MSKQPSTHQEKSRHSGKNDNKDNLPESSAINAEGGQATQPTVMIDGQEYTLESLGQQGREQLQNLRVTDQELQRLRDQLAITQTARNTYACELNDAIKNAAPVK
ncbi:DUF6447 family protein [Halomonas sp. SpR8]|uniref:DUF6447 family protein n=1 Tax=Halomonas sp. SpR8 TaxID=3050463 RepID=UPI0027E4DC3F|nr:DUF6447 family protein [Halomonas sp. SpR8]MDQ7730284.1 DUF6447 family protein [Halomonas sp. SpR8]